MLTIICNNTGNASIGKAEDFSALIIGRCSYNFLLYHNRKTMEKNSSGVLPSIGRGGWGIGTLTIFRERSKNGATQSGIISVLIIYLAFSNSCFSLNEVV